jgi:VIT1/CCC1 family predicted Fe2+/Mn2+ transporter
LAELAALYEAKGLSPGLARQVALELSARDALAAHIDAEHRLPLRDIRGAPDIIAVGAGIAYAAGSTIPLLAVLLARDDLRAPVTFVATVASLAATSFFLARVGVSRVANTLTRNVLVGMTAMGLSLLAGWLLRP